MCALHREKSNFRLNWWFSFNRYILEVTAKEAIKFLFMEQENCDYDIAVGKALREDKALNTIRMSRYQNKNIHMWQLKKWEVDSNIISNEEICGDNSSNKKIWWRRLPGDGISKDMVTVILAIKQNLLASW